MSVNADSADSNENSFYQILPNFSFWIMTDCIYNLRWDTKWATDQKKVFQKWSNLQKRCALLWQWFFSSWVFFCRLSVIEIWSILYMVDYAYTYTKCPYTKSTISQWLKVAQKTHELKNNFPSNAHLSWKFDHFWTIFFSRMDFFFKCLNLFFKRGQISRKDAECAETDKK